LFHFLLFVLQADFLAELPIKKNVLQVTARVAELQASALTVS
jgi:hypothetical protein